MPFIVFEGVEGSGKSTQARRLVATLGTDAVLTKEPGGTVLGRGIREMLLHPGHGHLAPAAEVLLFYADRAQNVAEIVRPALDKGKTVVSDRYVASSLAYQGYGRGISLELLRAVTRLATGGLAPDVNVFLDVPVEVGLARVRDRGARDRMESERFAFYERVRAGYKTLIEAKPHRWVTVDGSARPDIVFEQVKAALGERGLLAAS